MKDRILIAILGGSALLALAIWLITSGGSEPRYERLRSLDLAATAIPTGGEGGPEPDRVRPSTDHRRLRIYVDVSESMAGYLPVGPEGGAAGFRTVAQLVPDHLLRLYGPIEAVQWVAVDDRLHPLGDQPRFRPGEFRGTETFLDLAVEEGFSLLAQGEIEAFALVTDLVATREVSGALGLYNAIREWLLAAEVRSGGSDFGLLGVRVPFHGVVNGKCQAVEGLGCWYSERGRGWHPLSAVVTRPFYVLIFGRSGLGKATGGPQESLVHQASAALLEDAENLGFEGRWELLTRLARPLPAALHCEVTGPGGGEQFALLRTSSGRYRCQQDQTVRMACRLEAGGEGRERPPAIGWKATAADLSWDAPLAEARIEDGRIVVDIDCAEARQEAPEGPLIFTSLLAEATEVAGGWALWSVESDEQEEQLDRTLQLRHFVAGTRPDIFQIQVEEPLLGERP